MVIVAGRHDYHSTFWKASTIRPYESCLGIYLCAFRYRPQMGQLYGTRTTPIVHRRMMKVQLWARVHSAALPAQLPWYKAMFGVYGLELMTCGTLCSIKFKFKRITIQVDLFSKRSSHRGQSTMKGKELLTFYLSILPRVCGLVVYDLCESCAIKNLLLGWADRKLIVGLYRATYIVTRSIYMVYQHYTD